MSFAAVLSAILTLTAGIGIFLIACQMMSTNLESASSNKLKRLFSKASKSKLLGVGIGALGTAAIQSSGATTVMAIGFVNAGIISLVQAATIIYGANIGTTITAQIVALGMFGGGGISTTVIFSACAGLGAFMALFSKSNSVKTTGGILAGFGMLFVGLKLMSGSMEDFAALEGVKLFLAKVSNPLLLVIIGAVFTAIIQSSSVMTSIALAMCVTGLISLDQGIFLTMGSNIGSCVVAIIAGVTSGVNAKRTALIHLLFNCSGVVVFLFVGLILWLVTAGSVSFGTLFNVMFPDAPQVQLAMFHTFFNVITVIIMLPLTEVLVNVVTRMIPERASEQEETLRLKYVDDKMLQAPPVAVEQTKKEILCMADLALENFDRSFRMITSLDFSEKDVFAKTEKEIDFINKSLIQFVVKLTDMQRINKHDHLYLATTFRTVRDIERIGDYAENIVEYAEELQKTGNRFSDEALKEVSKLQEMVHSLFDKALAAYQNEDFSSLDAANVIEEEIDDYTKSMEENHIARMEQGRCNSSSGSQYMKLASDTERIADHLINVAKTIRNINKTKAVNPYEN